MISVKGEGIELRRTLDSEETIHIDKFQFTTALLNILENAVKYCSGSPKIDCIISSKESYFKIEIADNGMGISKENQKQIFDKFFRIDQNEIHNVKGLGLGLYYTNEIIKAHDGKIDIDSKPGSGSTFTITIPLN